MPRSHFVPTLTHRLESPSYLVEAELGQAQHDMIELV